MECNRDEALRARAIAESKFRAKDIEGAKRLALKAESLYPGLEGIPQMIATLNVHLSAQSMADGDKDWYAVLGVAASADDETVKKQYRRLALLLHPDKNKSVGAESAFKLISEAWSVLSDRSRRLAYDKKRNIKVFKHRPPPPPPPPTMTKTKKESSAGFFGFPRPSPPPPPPPVVPHHNTFWTVCNQCKMQYEYLRVYLNHNLLCPNCHEPFLAVEIPVPTKGGPCSVRSNGFGGGQSYHWGAFPSSTGKYSGSTQPVNPPHATETRKKQATLDSSFSRKRKNLSTASEAEELSTAGAAHETDRSNGSVSDPGKARAGPRQGREILLCDVRSMLLLKAKSLVLKKLEELNSEKERPKQRRKDSKKDEEKDKEDAKEEKEVVAINVPDPDFHDFDSDRSESSFGPDQVWATYDDEDGMPRFYVMVQKVISLKPFEVRLSFLNSKSTAEFGSGVDWVGSGFAKTCGDFRVGRYEVQDTVNIFSHRVQWEKGPRGAIRVVPRTGDIWAIYRNWSPGWNNRTPEEEIYKYDMVEVVEDFGEEGVLVAPLVKVNGFKTVFKRATEAAMRRIPKEETFRFSHQVPSHVLTGVEAENVPKGSFELDPAATPPDLLHIHSNPSGD
ncbi:uncharacterized protein LOC144704239 [Wolffia australiana]